MFNNIKMSVFSKFLVTLLQNKYLFSRDLDGYKTNNFSVSIDTEKLFVLRLRTMGIAISGF